MFKSVCKTVTAAIHVQPLIITKPVVPCSISSFSQACVCVCVRVCGLSGNLYAPSVALVGSRGASILYGCSVSCYHVGTHHVDDAGLLVSTMDIAMRSDVPNSPI